MKIVAHGILFGGKSGGTMAEKLAEMKGNLKDLQEDNGKAIAYVYRGKDPEVLKEMHNAEMYVMSRKSPSASQTCIKAHVLAPDDRDTKRAYQMMTSGFEPVGFVDNHYADVLGLVNPDPATSDKNFKITRVINGFQYINPSQMIKAQENWLNTHPTLEESKAPIRDMMRNIVSIMETAKDEDDLQRQMDAMMKNAPKDQSGFNMN